MQEVNYRCDGCKRDEHSTALPAKATHGSTALYLIPDYESGYVDSGVRVTHCRNNEGFHLCEECGKPVRDAIIEDAIQDGLVLSAEDVKSRTCSSCQFLTEQGECRMLLAVYGPHSDGCSELLIHSTPSNISPDTDEPAMTINEPEIFGCNRWFKRSPVERLSEAHT